MSFDEFGDVSVNVLSSRAQLVAYLAELNHEAVDLLPLLRMSLGDLILDDVAAVKYLGRTRELLSIVRMPLNDEEATECAFYGEEPLEVRRLFIPVAGQAIFSGLSVDPQPDSAPWDDLLKLCQSPAIASALCLMDARDLELIRLEQELGNLTSENRHLRAIIGHLKQVVEVVNRRSASQILDTVGKQAATRLMAETGLGDLLAGTEHSIADINDSFLSGMLESEVEQLVYRLTQELSEDDQLTLATHKSESKLDDWLDHLLGSDVAVMESDLPLADYLKDEGGNIVLHDLIREIARSVLGDALNRAEEARYTEATTSVGSC